jgi:raffinose/stachyose/melibiose transport system substrate-binding protein
MSDSERGLGSDRAQFILNCIGFGLVGICFLVSLYQVFSANLRGASDDTEIIRLAHWQLESGIREAIDKLSARYTEIQAARGRKVRVEQLPIPERIYPNWLLTKLVGEEAPELVEIRSDLVNVDRLSRFFTPISTALEEPNPYNAGTPLEGKPWRETFLDGLQGPGTFSRELLEYYAVGFNLHTIRIFYNETLFREIMGPDALPPKTFQQFIDLCEMTLDYSRRTGRTIVPLAGSKYTAPFLLQRLMSNQTQKLKLSLDENHGLRPSDDDILVSYLEGKWDLRQPEIQSGLRLQNRVGRYMTPGFTQLQREDSSFAFVQGRALMILTGSWDVKSLSEEALFPVGAFRLPLPDGNDSEFGEFALGQVSEAATGTSTPFGLPRGAPNSDLALDFLKFATSYEGNRIFVETSEWMPAIATVPVPEHLSVFAPISDGYDPGFDLSLGSDFKGAYARNRFLLFEANDPLPRFTAAQEAQAYLIAVDLKRKVKALSQNTQRLDPMLASQMWQTGRSTGEANANANSSTGRKLWEMVARQNAIEIQYYELEERLNSSLATEGLGQSRDKVSSTPRSDRPKTPE